MDASTDQDPDTRRRRWLLPTLIIAGIVVIALVLWLVISPLVTTTPTKPAPVDHGVAPDITAISQWQPIISATDTGANSTRLVASGDVAVDLQQFSDGWTVQAIDLGTGQIVWGPIALNTLVTSPITNVTASAAGGVVILLVDGGHEGVALQIDPATGAVKQQWTYPNGVLSATFSGSYWVLVSGPSGSPTCSVRATLNLAKVAAQGPALECWVVANRYLEGTDSLIDLTTGKSVNLDDGKYAGSNFYGTDPNTVLKASHNLDPSGFTYVTAYDIATKRALWAEPVTFSGMSYQMFAEPAGLVLGTLPTESQGVMSITAYKFTDGSQAWQVQSSSPIAGDWDSPAAIGDWMFVTAGSGNPDYALKISNGAAPQALLSDISWQFFGERVAYGRSSADGSLNAYDGSSGALKLLWSTESPVPDLQVEYMWAGSHIAAYTPDGSIWTL